MTRCCQQHPMPWNGVTGAIARCKKVSTACGRKRRSVHVLHWICGVKLKPKAVNKLLHYFIVLERDKPGSSATVSRREVARRDRAPRQRGIQLRGRATAETGRPPILGLVQRRDKTDQDAPAAQ